ncbi:hypothetical protein RG959_00800 [Domibacillus sp. 8LH]|uniref:hypothetical protein n=1 Tax=Domibacillus sp. 8LH TaxID=3073900 RepID=UPI00317C4556
MNETTSLVAEIIGSLKELGGTGTLDEIYRKVEQRNRVDLTIYVDWRSRVRTTIYDHSSDTDRFNGQKQNLFQLVDRKGKGIWQLNRKNNHE